MITEQMARTPRMVNFASILALYNLIFLVPFLQSQSVEDVLDTYEADYSLDFKKSELEPLVSESRNETHTQFPYLVFLYYEGHYRCLATLISDRLVMTAIHCVNDGRTVQNTSAFIGYAAGSVKGVSPKLRMEFEAIHEYHELINSEENAIAILVTKERVAFSADVGRICLSKDPSKEWKYQDLVAVAVHKINNTEQVPKSGHVKVVNNALCRIVSVSKMCVFGESTVLCKGDSGGPLIAEKQGVSFQIGILLGAGSWERRIPEKKECGKLVVYEPVSRHYYKFIEEVAKSSNSDVCFLG